LSKRRDWVFDPVYYSSVDARVASFDKEIIAPAAARFDETRDAKSRDDEGAACLTGRTGSGVGFFLRLRCSSVDAAPPPRAPAPPA
jgi:hypothetical protein